MKTHTKQSGVSEGADVGFGEGEARAQVPVRTEALAPGMVFDRALVDARGEVLLQEGEELSEEVCRVLRGMAGAVFAAREAAMDREIEVKHTEGAEGSTPRRVIWEFERQCSLNRGELRRMAEGVVASKRERWAKLSTRVVSLGGAGAAQTVAMRPAMGEMEMEARERMWADVVGSVLDEGRGETFALKALSEELVDLANRQPSGLLLDALSANMHECGSVRQVAGQALRVGMLTALVGVRLGWADVDVQAGVLAALLADSGMLLVPLAVRSAARALADEEFNQVRRHTAYSVAIVERLSEGSTQPLPEAVGLAVYQHHERENARGYPDLSSGRNVHDFAKVIGACDVVVGMISARAHRPGCDPSRGVREVVHSAARGELSGRVVRALVDVCGLYPPGSRVRLSTGHPGVVVARGVQRDGLKPVVRLLRARGTDEQRVVDLAHPSAGSVRVAGPLAA